MQYILTGVIVLIFSGLVIHGLTLLLERGYRALFGIFAGAADVPRKVKMKVPRKSKQPSLALQRLKGAADKCQGRWAVLPDTSPPATAARRREKSAGKGAPASSKSRGGRGSVAL